MNRGEAGNGRQCTVGGRRQQSKILHRNRSESATMPWSSRPVLQRTPQLWVAPSIKASEWWSHPERVSSRTLPGISCKELSSRCQQSCSSEGTHTLDSSEWAGQRNWNLATSIQDPSISMGRSLAIIPSLTGAPPSCVKQKTIPLTKNYPLPSETPLSRSPSRRPTHKLHPLQAPPVEALTEAGEPAAVHDGAPSFQVQKW